MKKIELGAIQDITYSYFVNRHCGVIKPFTSKPTITRSQSDADKSLPGGLLATLRSQKD